MSRCVRSCGRKAQPKKRLCLTCEDRQFSRDHDQGRYKPPRRFRARDYEKSYQRYR